MLKAKFTIGGVNHQVMEIRPAEFDEIMKNSNICKMVGLPYVFDENLRLWPKPRKGLRVEFYRG